MLDRPVHIAHLFKQVKGVIHHGGAGLAKGHLTKLSNFDKRMSEKVQRNDNTFVELSLFCVPAHMFNRMIIVFPMGLCVLLGAFKYDAML